MLSERESQTPQSKRFIAAALELGTDQDEGTLDDVFGKVVLPKPATIDTNPESEDAEC